jgi:hypothetical protein
MTDTEPLESAEQVTLEYRSSEKSVLEALTALENEAWTRADANDDSWYSSNYLAQRVTMILSGMGIVSSDDILAFFVANAALTQEKPRRVHALSNLQLKRLSESAVVLIYRADYFRIDAANEVVAGTTGCVDCSTVFVKEAGAWKCVFHQQTLMK